MNLTVNGEPRVSAAATVLGLLEELGLDPRAKGLAVALNGALAPRASWNETALAEGDDLEIVRPVRGG